MPIIDDRREDKSKPWGYCIATDSFMSGWGGAEGGRSLFAVPVANPKEAEIVLENLRYRSEMKRPRLVNDAFKVRLYSGDHLSIRDREDASRFYEKGGFLHD